MTGATGVLLDAITQAVTRPSLREVILDALNDAYWCHQGEVEDCAACRQHPAGVCADPDQQTADAHARDYEEARKQIERSPGDPEVLAVFAGLSGGTA